MSGAFDASRRRFLRIGLTASGALVVGFRLDDALAQSSSVPPDLLGDELTELTAFVMIERGNRVVIGAPACETGQGAITAYPMLVAEELGVAWPQVRVTQLAYGYRETDGNASNRFGNQSGAIANPIGEAWTALRTAGATARAMLVAAAAREWSLPVEQLRTAEGHVIAPDDRRISYGALARGAASQPPPAQAPALKDPATFTLLGTPVRTTDVRNVVTGRTRYASDDFLSGGLIAVVLRCPHLGGRLESVDEAAARKVPGVREIVVLEPAAANTTIDGPSAAGIAVVAESTWAALQGRAALVPVWTPGPFPEESNATLAATAHALLDAATDGVVVRQEGDMPGSRKRARLSLSARYELPFLAHATMEPPSAAIELRQDGALLIAGIEDPDAASALIAELTGLPRSGIEIRLPRSGGSFGRRLRNDFVAEAVQVAKAVGKPVKLVWTREDDLANDRYRPFGLHAMTATLDRANRIAGWSHHCAATPASGREAGAPAWRGCVSAEAFPAGFVEHLDTQFHALESGLPRHDMRKLRHGFDTFATQCFLDEIAFETRRDPVRLRLDMLGEPREVPAGEGGIMFDTGRMAAVLSACAERIQWSTKRTDGHGLGIACHATGGGYVAHAFEIGMDGERVRIHRAVCVVDVGRVINPLGLENRVASAVVDGLSTALNLAVTVKAGQVQQKNFPDYRLLTAAGAPPKVEVHALPSTLDPVGVGELATSSVAAALANAIFATTTVRVRKLPLMPELLRML